MLRFGQRVKFALGRDVGDGWQEATVFGAPLGTPDPATTAEMCDPDGPWILMHPAVPDALPEDPGSVQD
jgi:hypothetical protein